MSLGPRALNALQQQVRRTIRRHGLLPAGSRVAIGLSGGSDSVALTFLLRDLAEHNGFAVAGLAHFNHQLRETAARDEGFCRDLGARLGLPVVVETADVKTYAASERLSLEDAARRLRYEFLTRAAEQMGADQVAVGHTEDDQAETFLLKLMRGAGGTGLGGVYPRRGTVVRPLLDVSRAELRAYLQARGERWVDDETNEDRANPRNRVRHVILPELARTLGGDARPPLARAAALVREDAAWLDELAATRFAALAATSGHGIELDTDALSAEPAPLRRRIVLLALRQVAGGREIGLEHVETALAILGSASGGADLPGSRVELRRGKMVLLARW